MTLKTLKALVLVRYLRHGSCHHCHKSMDHVSLRVPRHVSYSGI